MPNATIANDTQREELKSCPEGFVVLRRLTYGQYLERRDMATQLSIEESEKTGKNKTDIVTMQRAVAAFEFMHTVVDHNLTGEGDQPLDFQNSNILNVLDPRVGQEISGLIDKMNQFEEEAKN